jgi:hypothetical protein
MLLNSSYLQYFSNFFQNKVMISILKETQLGFETRKEAAKWSGASGVCSSFHPKHGELP